MRFIFYFISLACCVLLASCNQAIKQRIETAEALAQENGFVKNIIPTQHFTLVTYRKIKRSGEIITVYIEGDGLAWFQEILEI